MTATSGCPGLDTPILANEPAPHSAHGDWDDPMRLDRGHGGHELVIGGRRDMVLSEDVLPVEHPHSHDDGENAVDLAVVVVDFEGQGEELLVPAVLLGVLAEVQHQAVALVKVRQGAAQPFVHDIGKGIGGSGDLHRLQVGIGAEHGQLDLDVGIGGLEIRDFLGNGGIGGLNNYSRKIPAKTECIAA